MTLAMLRWTTILLLCAGACGCSYFQATTNDDDIDLTELDEGEKAEPDESSRNASSHETDVEERKTEPALKIGDRFPFSKSVEHRLTQVDNDETQVSACRTDIVLVIVVDNVLPDGRKLLTVHFQDVQYQLDIPGKKISYTSGSPNRTVPPEALFYAGLANNRFSFWVGSNNSVTDVLGYPDFLRRCLRAAPEQHKPIVQQQFEAMKSVDAIANFVDESIGMFRLNGDPGYPGIVIKKGTTWEMEPRYCDNPIPMVTNTQCILKDISPDAAEILVTSRINGTRDTVTMRDLAGDLKVTVKGGNGTGSCRVNSQTGLPITSHTRRSLELVMELPDGRKIQQVKDTECTFSLIADSAQVPGSNSGHQIHQTSLPDAIGVDTPRRVVPSGFSRQN